MKSDYQPEFDLIVYYDGTQNERTAKQLPLFATGLFVLFFIVRGFMARSFFTISLQILLFGLIALLMSSSILYLFFAPPTSVPLLTMSEKGIGVRNFGLIPWSNVHDVAPYRYKNSPIVSLGIRVKDNKILSEQASFQGRCQIFWSRIFGYPQIILSSLTVSYDEIIRYSEHFLDKKK